MSTIRLSIPISERPTAKMKLGEIIDEHEDMRLAKARLAAAEREIEARMEKLAAQAVALMRDSEIDKSSGKRANGRIEEKEHYNITNPAELAKWARRTGHLEIYQSRVSAGVYVELSKAGMRPPGITSRPETKFYTTSRKSKE